MAKPKSSNRSIRLPDAMWARLVAEAERRQLSVNGVVAEFVDAGLAGAVVVKTLSGNVTHKLPTIRNTAAVKSEPLLSAKGEPVTHQGVALHVDVPVIGSSIPYAGDMQRKPYQKGSKK